MKARWGILVLAVVLIVSSYVLQWYSSGGFAAQLSLDDGRVKDSLDYLASDRWDHMLADGEVQRAWVSSDRRGYKVSLIVEYDRYPWRVSVVFSPGAEPLEHSVKLSGGLSLYTRRAGISIAFLWFAGTVLVPFIFGKKCPDCTGSFWHPVYLEAEETIIYPGGFDDDNYSLPAIGRRDFVCRRCGYRLVTYYVPFSPRAGRIIKSMVVIRGSRQQTQTLGEMLDRWFEENPKRTKFHTYDEWRACYDELKASEHEERAATPK